jgi:hypothetical protein
VLAHGSGIALQKSALTTLAGGYCERPIRQAAIREMPGK